MIYKNDLEEVEIQVTVKNPNGMSFVPKRYETKTVLRIPRLYGGAHKEKIDRERKERQDKWRKISPEKRLKLLEVNIPSGALKEKARLRGAIEKMNSGRTQRKT